MPRILFDRISQEICCWFDFSLSEELGPNVLLERIPIIHVFQYFNGLTVDLFSLN